MGRVITRLAVPLVTVAVRTYASCSHHATTTPAADHKNIAPINRLALVLPMVLALTMPSAPPRPAQVGMVSFVAASRNSLTLHWPKVRGAKAYEVFRSTHTSMSGASLTRRPTSTTVTVSGLTAGKTYCFQVRARTGSSVGIRSVHTCKPTIRAQSRVGGPSYAVMTLNACTDLCAGWSSRRPAALAMIGSRRPDVLATQEALSWGTPPPGYALAYYKNSQRLFYKTSRFVVATTSGTRRVGSVALGTQRAAIWAELVDRSTGKHLVFVSAHTIAAYTQYVERGREINALLTSMKQVNTVGLTVVFAGDFNSHKHRGTYNEATGFGSQDTVARAFASAGYYDAYDLASTLKRPNWNSYSDFRSVPRVCKIWGDHVDHVFVKPANAHVWRWMNAALYSGDRYLTPMPSDHSPVQVDLYLP